MKQLVAALLFFLIVPPSFGQNRLLEKKHGIRDIKLGSSKSIYTDLYRVSSKIKCGEMYCRKNENLFIGSARAERIMYLYIDNALAGIYVVFDNDNDLHAVMRALRGLYGLPELSQDSTQMQWSAVTFGISATTAPRALSYVVKDFPQKCESIDRRTMNAIKQEL